MGNKQSILQDIQIFKPPADDLVLKDPGINFKIYQHKYKNFQVMAHKITLHSQKQLPILIQNFKARCSHHYLVSTVYLNIQDYSSCGGYYQVVIFYQRLFTDLSKIKDIPFSDVLHFYAVAFKGFQLLYRRFGYFQIYEDMFHLGQDSKLKVWCNKNISKNQPQQYLIDKNGTQEDMLRKIVYIISQNTDVLTDQIRLKQKLLAYGIRNFQMANQSLRQICRQFNLSVPQRVQCMNALPSQQVQIMLDLYTSQNSKINAEILNSQLMNSAKANKTYNQSLLNTPKFNTIHTLQHAPITQQFIIPQSRNNLPQLKLLSNQKRVNDQSMIHTFNKRPQVSPVMQFRKGLDVSLNQTSIKKPRRNSSSSQTSIIRNMSTPITKNNNQLVYLNNAPRNQDYKSLQKRSQTRLNAYSFNKNSNLNIQFKTNNYNEKLFNQPIHNNGLTKSIIYSPSQPFPQQNPIKNVYPPIYPNNNNQINFTKPVVVRPNNHLPQYSKPVQNYLPSNIHSINNQTQHIKYEYRPNYYSAPKFSTNMINYVGNRSQIVPGNNILTQSLKKSHHSLVKQSKVFDVNNSYNTNSQLLYQNNKQISSKIGHNNHPQSYSLNLIQPQQSRYITSPNYQVLINTNTVNNSQKYQSRERRNSSKYKNQQKSSSINNSIKKKKLQSEQIINKFMKRDYSTPVISQNLKNDSALSKSKQNPFKLIQQNQKISTNKTIINSLNQKSNLNLQGPFQKSNLDQQFNAHSASSRYLYSNRQLNDNIPDVKIKKYSPKKNIQNLFENNRIQQLQSFNQSKFGTQNSLKDQNSRVLQIIGRQKKNSVTSAFEDQEKNMKKDYIVSKQNLDRAYNKNSKNNYEDTFTTDPRILQILKKSSSKTLKNQINNLKKVTKPIKPYQFNNDTFRRPVVNKQVHEDILKLQKSWNKQPQMLKKQYSSTKTQFTQFQGFPSLSNLSQIKKSDDNSFNEQKLLNISPLKDKNLSKKSRFSEDKSNNNVNVNLNKRQQHFISQFYNYEYTSPTYQYSFNDKKQIIPNKDNQWKNVYATALNNSKEARGFNDSKDDTISSKVMRSNQFNVVPQKPFNYLTTFGSNESLASLEFQLSKKSQLLKTLKDKVKQSHDQTKFTDQSKSINTRSQLNKKYNPRLDPQITKDLQRFRKERQQVSNK